jgi:hypothetical protein
MHRDTCISVCQTHVYCSNIQTECVSFDLLLQKIVEVWYSDRLGLVMLSALKYMYVYTHKCTCTYVYICVFYIYICIAI